MLSISKDGVQAVLARGEFSINTVGVAIYGSTIVYGLYYKLDVAGCGRKAEQDSGSECEQILHVQMIRGSKTREAKQILTKIKVFPGLRKNSVDEFMISSSPLVVSLRLT